MRIVQFVRKLNSFLNSEYNQYDLISLKQQQLIIMYNLLLGYTKKYPVLSEVFEEQEIQNAKIQNKNITVSINDVEKLVNEYELFNPRQKIDYIFDQCQTEETVLKAKDMVELFADRISDWSINILMMSSILIRHNYVKIN